jgi:RNA polymerase sigma-70 factor (ECF subfamily)
VSSDALGSVDADLIRRAQRGDPTALHEVVVDLMPYVGRICGAIAMDNQDDAMQEAMLAIVRHLRSLREPAALRGWARRIAVREAIRAGRGGRSTPATPEALAAIPDLADEATPIEVRVVLESLTPEQRAVLVLRDLEGLREDEIAATLGITPGTVKSRIHRARAAFRQRWRS